MLTKLVWWEVILLFCKVLLKVVLSYTLRVLRVIANIQIVLDLAMIQVYIIIVLAIGDIRVCR